MSGKSGKKIPRPYRRPISERKFAAMLKTLSDRSEEKNIRKCFPLGDDGKHRFTKPQKEKDAVEIAGILKKVHKVRTGPRTVRLVFLLVIVAAPIIFNIVFLDKIAAKYLETGLEALTETDVNIVDLEIKVLVGRVSLQQLAFASLSDPMIDDLKISDLTADISWSSLFYRRAVVDELGAEIAFAVPRDTPAEYPKKVSGDRRTDGDIAVKENNLAPFFDILSDSVVPNESIDLVKKISADSWSEYQTWSNNLNDDYEAAIKMSESVSSFLSEPLPDTSDVGGWLKKVEEGNRLVNEVEGKRNLIEEYQSEIKQVSAETSLAVRQARAAVENDLAKIESTLALDSNQVNNWVASLISGYAGPRLGEFYKRAIDLADRVERKPKSAEKSELRRRRMTIGRIVPFPISLPPRFSIKKLMFSGEGITVTGENVGIDHKLAGAPSHVALQLDNLSGTDSRLNADITIDGRDAADNLLFGTLDTDGWPWLAEQNGLGGNLALDAVFSIQDFHNGPIISEGRVELSNWKGSISAGPVSFINEDSPALGFLYTMIFREGQPDLSINVENAYLREWGGMIADSALSMGKEKAREALLANVDADLDGLDSLMANWDGQESLLDNLSSRLTADESDLKKQISEWTKKSGVELPVPEEASSLLGDLGSLF